MSHVSPISSSSLSSLPPPPPPTPTPLPVFGRPPDEAVFLPPVAAVAGVGALVPGGEDAVEGLAAEPIVLAVPGALLLFLEEGVSCARDSPPVF